MDRETSTCEICEESFTPLGDKENIVNYEHINETGRCIDCYEEYGDQWPDKL